MDFFENDLQFTKIIFRDRFYHPPEINASIHDLISYFRANIVSNTPFIYLFAPNHIKTIIAYFAIIKSGHVCVLVEPDIGRLELAEMKQDTPPCALVHIDRVTDTFNYNTEIVFTRDNPREFDWDELSDVATIVYTNAEDGYAKGAMLTRKNLLANAEGGKISDSITERNVFCALLPFHHMFGLQTGILTPLFSESSIVIEDTSNSIKAISFANAIRDHHVTNLYAVPIIYHLLNRVPDIREAISSVEKTCSGACALPKRVYDSFLNKTGKEIAEGYGLTEASPVCAWHRNNEKVKIGSVGRAYPFCEVKIVNENGKENSANSQGEVCVKGLNIMKGYYRKINATRLVFDKGWFRTGDLGYKDKNGFIFLTGLKKRMANYAGKKIFLSEVERFFLSHDSVSDVHVYCGEKPLLGQMIQADIQLKINNKENRDELMVWCHNNLTIYKIPAKIVFF